MGTRLYVGNLSYNVTEPELRDVFAEGGKNVVEVKVVMDRETGQPRGFAFVEMGSEDEASQAIQTLSGREIQGRAISVSEARERAPRAGRRWRLRRWRWQWRRRLRRWRWPRWPRRRRRLRRLGWRRRRRPRPRRRRPSRRLVIARCARYAEGATPLPRALPKSFAR